MLLTIAAVMATTLDMAGPSSSMPEAELPGAQGEILQLLPLRDFRRGIGLRRGGVVASALWQRRPGFQRLRRAPAGSRLSGRWGGIRAWLSSLSWDPTPLLPDQVLRGPWQERGPVGVPTRSSSRLWRWRRERSQRDGLLPRDALLARSPQAASLGYSPASLSLFFVMIISKSIVLISRTEAMKKKSLFHPMSCHSLFLCVINRGGPFEHGAS